mmetsp:Transcript_80655/g.224476  ORF Transcript_80655/g.224476 Transcript_80655/m.224476 type:complete len:327 (-) Transcript_80655:213-1193(-)
MEISWLALLVLPLVGTWILWPYLRWRAVSWRPLEAQVARTSFKCLPGELVPPAWKPPELTLSVIVPAFNEEYRLPQMLEETLAYLEARAARQPGFTYEVLVVDDGSFDATFAAALGSWGRGQGLRKGSAWGELRVLQLNWNRGKGFAVQAGMLAARGQLLLLADADGATRIGDLERLERALGPSVAGLGGSEGGVQIVFGSRYHLREESMPRTSRLQNAVTLAFDVLVWALVGWQIHDTQCGFKLFRADVGKRIFSSVHLHGWAFDVEVLLLARVFGRRIAEVPVSWIDMPGSKFNTMLSAMTMFRDIVLMKVLYFLGIWSPSTTA